MTTETLPEITWTPSPDCGTCAGIMANKDKPPWRRVWASSPHCFRCGLHGPEGHTCKLPAGTTANVCPRCFWERREAGSPPAKRAVMDVRQAMNLGQHKTYAPFCEPCLLDEGYVRLEEGPVRYQDRNGKPKTYTYVFWEKPLAADIRIKEETRDPFNGLSAKEREIAKAEIMANAHRGGVRQPSAMRLRPKVKA